MKDLIKIRKMTKKKWLNLFEAQYINAKSKVCNWIFVSRKKRPYEEKDNVDAVVIVPVIDTPSGKRLVVTKEFRLPIFGYEYGFPAGIIEEGESIESTVKREMKEETGLDLVSIVGKSNTLISSAGLSDESVVIVLADVTGEISIKNQEEIEDIETFLYDINDIKNLLASDKKISAKAWGFLYHFSRIGKIE